MAAIYDKERPSIEEYVKPFRLIDSQVAGLDAFGKLLESCALDAIDWYDPDKEQKARTEITRIQESRGSQAGGGTQGRSDIWRNRPTDRVHRNRRQIPHGHSVCPRIPGTHQNDREGV